MPLELCINEWAGEEEAAERCLPPFVGRLAIRLLIVVYRALGWRRSICLGLLAARATTTRSARGGGLL